MRTFTALMLALFSQLSFAIYEGQIEALEFGPSYGNVVYVNVVGSQDDRPVCATNTNGYDFAFYMGDTVGDKVFTVLYDAQKNSSTLMVRGTGDCTVGRGVEDIRWIQVK